MPIISGTVYDEVGNPAANKIVRAYRQDTGALIGNATTTSGGNYEISTGAFAGVCNVIALDGELEDPLSDNVVSLLHFNGVEGATSVYDEKEKVWTTNGQAKISTAQSRFGGSSLLLDGSGDYLTTPSTSALTAAGVDFTVEAWVRPTASKTLMGLLTKRPSSSGSEFALFLDSGKLRAIGWGASGVTRVDITGLTPVPLNTWSHVALSVSGTTWRLFLDGVLDASGEASGAIQSSSETVYIGRDRTNTARDFSGYIDELRWTTGAARYAANFTPPTNPFSLGIAPGELPDLILRTTPI